VLNGESGFAASTGQKIMTKIPPEGVPRLHARFQRRQPEGLLLNLSNRLLLKLSELLRASLNYSRADQITLQQDSISWRTISALSRLDSRSGCGSQSPPIRRRAQRSFHRRFSGRPEQKGSRRVLVSTRQA
jgi:hypothetical protein